MVLRKDGGNSARKKKKFALNFRIESNEMMQRSTEDLLSEKKRQKIAKDSRFLIVNWGYDKVTLYRIKSNFQIVM